jgi:hypothetical protein
MPVRECLLSHLRIKIANNIFMQVAGIWKSRSAQRAVKLLHCVIIPILNPGIGIPESTIPTASCYR